MGMTGANGFPCCSKDSVDIVETQIDLNQHELQPSHEELPPAQEESQPAQEEFPPAQEESQPAQEESQPAQEESQPAQEESQPAQEESQPAQEEPQPAQEESQPAQEEPQPAQEELPPAQEEPQPAQEEPQPAQEEDEEEEDELLHLNVPPKEDPEQDTKLVQEANTPPPLEYCPPWEYCPAPMLKPEAKQDSSWKVCNEDLESSLPLEGALTQQDSITSPSITDEEQVDSTHRSIFVQTSKHLFWADKDIQASEHSLDLETGMHRGERTEKIASPLNQKAAPEPVPVKQFQDESTQAELSEPGTRQPSDTHLPYPCLTPAINLQDLVNFASSLAIASSSNRDLPSLEHMMKSPPQKAVEPSTVPMVPSAVPMAPSTVPMAPSTVPMVPSTVPMVESTTLPAKEEPEQEKLSGLQERASEKSLEAGEPLESAKQEDKTLRPYFDFSKPEPQRTAFKGKVKFIQAPARSSSLNGDRKDSVPGTKKETPLMLKIHFKLLPTSSPREMTKQNQ
ncbi:spermatogenesis-associated protein 32 isoform X2 [Myotis daubentonii]|uniref:spermatogenesis-associated protein 32 isoform X2 n=1 Tax=Myotis daubentonii TaxID=98922 RepID=UPI0028739910|nr:spermatogenesis-associated protein 32 isoform X2 [Myotis daubentonii]